MQGSTNLHRRISKFGFQHSTCGSIGLNCARRGLNSRILVSHFQSKISNASIQTSNFKIQIPQPYLRLVALLFVIVAASACNRIFPPRHISETNRPELAGQFRDDAIKDAGGRGIWIKHSGRLHRGQTTGASLQVLATPQVYNTVIAAARQVSAKNHFDLGYQEATATGGLHAVTLKVMRPSGDRVFQIQVREVPRLLRAAIVIDDVGNEAEPARTLAALDYPLTLSVLPYLRFSEVAAEEAHRGGHEVMLHLPMEPEPNSHISPGQGAILEGMSAAEVRTIVDEDLNAIPYVAGVNNHMGSRVTQDRALMSAVMGTLAGRHVYFIDSRTTAASVALEVARREHVPTFYRTVFLDDTESVSYTLGQMREFRRIVERDGVALAIGHPHPTTITALEQSLAEFERADIELVTPSQIVRLPEVAALRPIVSK